MKTYIKQITVLLPLILLLAGLKLHAQDFTQQIEKTATFEDASSPSNSLRIYNIHGDVRVEGYGGEEIRISAVKEIDARDKGNLEKGIEEVRLIVEEEENLILVYIDAPFINLKRYGDKIDYRIDRWDSNYEYYFDILLQVPERINLHASTINRGDVTVVNIRGDLSVANVNGKVTLTKVAGMTEARTVNGNITADYLESPAENSKYKTVNGKIEVRYPDDFSADIRFESLHGNLYTDFQNITRLSSRVHTDRKSSRSGVRYKIDKHSPIRIGNGGPEFSFEVLNGNVYIKKIKS